MPYNKLVIRRLPPSMSEDDFLKQVFPLPNHDYFCFFEANSGLGPHSFSRAYINFSDDNDMSIFRERFDNYVFLDKDGHEYPAVVEQSLWHKSPKNGPFCKNDSLADGGASSDQLIKDSKELNEVTAVAAAVTSASNSKSTSPLWIEQDPEFISFIEKLRVQKTRPQNSPIQTLETNLDELTNSTNNASSRSNSKVITPLIGYVNQQRNLKNFSKRTR